MTSFEPNHKLLRYVNVKGQKWKYVIGISCLFVFSSILLFACMSEPNTIKTEMTDTPLQILALGDSYTIGEGVDPSQRWPVQLAAALRAESFRLDDHLIIARTGWTTGDLLAAIEATDPQGPFDLVTLLIGVNNQYQGRDIESYRNEFRTLLGIAVDFAGEDPSRVVVLSIPDWGVTPFAQSRDRAQIAAAIDQFNLVNREKSLAAGVHYLDITPLSRQAADDPTLLATDGLHPSGKMYAAWVELLLPIAREILTVRTDH
jgi:lysophospholipase L1-like esterase